MAKKQRNEILVGAFAALSIGLLVLLFFLKGTLGDLFTPVGEFRVVFDDVRGLKVGDPVFVHGLKVGHVSAEEFRRIAWGKEHPALYPGESGETARVLITVQLAASARALVRSDSPVEIDKNLTGIISLLVRPGKGPLLAEGAGAVLRGNPGIELGMIADRMSNILLKIDPVVEEFAALSQRLNRSGKIDSGLDDLAGLARDLREGVGPIEKQVGEALASIQQILAENRSDVRRITGELAGSAELARKILEKVEPASGKLEGALAQLERAAASAAGAIEGNRAGLDSIVEEARSALANAANITADVRRRPWRLLYKPSKGESDSLDLYDAAWAYNLGAAGLERSLHELSERIEKEKAQGRSDPENLRTAYLKVEESLKHHKEVEDAFWARLKDH